MSKFPLRAEDKMGRKLKTTNPFKDIDNSFTKTVTFIGEEQAKRMGRKYCLLESDSVVINDYPCKGRKKPFTGSRL